MEQGKYLIRFRGKNWKFWNFRYTLMMLEKAQKSAGVIAASAGNHALALAYHGGQLSK